MKHLFTKAFVVGLLVAAAWSGRVQAQQPPADVVLTNGKIVTVDDQFRVAQAVAIRGDRFVAVGSNADIAKLTGPNTRQIDLGGKTVLPGLIDAHAHLMRAAETWAIEARFDDIESRKQALDLVKAKAAQLGPGQWVFNLGGWSYDQFADNPTPLTRAELDAAAGAVVVDEHLTGTHLARQVGAPRGWGLAGQPLIHMTGIHEMIMDEMFARLEAGVTPTFQLHPEV